jgi:hypothetical protein
LLRFTKARGNQDITYLSKKSFAEPNEFKTPPKTNAVVVKLGNVTASKIILDLEWKWSECLQPAAGGDGCQAGHVGVIIQGIQNLSMHNLDTTQFCGV